MKFWNFIHNDDGGRVLRLDGPIAEDSFWGDEVTPQDFRKELEEEEGDIIVAINSLGGSVFAAAEIYTMLKNYKGKVTAQVESIAASAASVIAMAADEVLMSPVSVLMVHNPITMAIGNEKDFEDVILTLKTIKTSIANAYALKAKKSVESMRDLMDGPLGNGSWMDADEALELGLIDGILFAEVGTEPSEEGGGIDDKQNLKARAKATYADFVNSLARGQDAAYAPQHRSAARRFAMAVGADGEDGDVQEDPGVIHEDPGVKPLAIGLDGKAPDGSMPYALLMRELENLR